MRMAGTAVSVDLKSGNWQVPLTGSHFIMFGVLSWVNRVSAVQELEQGFASVW
ncbi:hypothetical protein YPPY32_0131 [Yersinia pestis PY-32]|nr:hypothetical protein YPPY32_1045 [Yersinia pestis PY-32]EIR85096.1 hypothetical protein YPPY32_0131 [Yersinia pestis PY-32]